MSEAGKASFRHTTEAHAVRSSFLDFFAKNGHERLPSAPIIPQNDPTLMFTAAGMVPFKDVFTGKAPRPAPRVTTSQKCIRISGKHNDLENVGVTARHHTFFEMLGNFSFGDYFKEEAIKMAWDLISREWQIPADRLIVSVFGGEGDLAPDDEARALWKSISGLPDERIVGMGADDNFWSAGDTGPCGPCTEIHFFHGKDGAPPTPEEVRTFGQVEPDHRGYGWMEIWNLVFMQFERSLVNGVASIAPLPKPCVDTGAGLERVTSVLEGKTSNYDTDLLASLVHKAADLAGKKYGASLADDDVSLRVIADHARTTAFLLAEGVHPDRTGRPYVLRRVMRRAIRHGHRLGIQKPFLHEVALAVVDSMGDVYPELVQRRAVIADVAEQEEVRFRETIDRGMKLLDEEVAQMRGRGQTIISGDVAFKLYDTFGFPLDLTEVIAKERDFTVDDEGYKAALEAQRSRSEGSKVGDEAVGDVFRALAEGTPATKFVGYEREESSGRVLAIATKGGKVDSAVAGDKVFVVLDQTPFYAESGGQVGDGGVLTAKDGLRVRIDDTQKPTASVFVLSGEVLEGTLTAGAEVEQKVDHATRSATRRNHSATHLLHWALRKTLGEQAAQKGSMVGPERLRFDYSYGKPLTPEEITTIERLVNEKILENAPIETEVLPIERARAKGAVAMFGEKYGETVRVLTMTQDSVEFCGGTHARALGDIGLFKILSDAGIAAGVRRIEAATGLNSLAYLQKLEGSLGKVARALKSGPDEVLDKVERLVETTHKQEKELAQAKKQAALGGGGAGGVEGMLAQAKPVGDAKALAVRIDELDAKTARELADQLRDRLGVSAVLVASSTGGKAQLVVTVEKGLSARVKAGDLVRDIAKIVSGSGGGRPDMAQAGGTEPGRLGDAMEQFYALVGTALTGA